MTVREPEFNDADRLVVLASRWAESRPRGRHGLLIDDVTDPANQFAWRARKPVRDFAQKAINAAQDAYRKQYPNDDMGSLYWGLEPL